MIFGSIILPSAVQEELSRPDAPEIVRGWASQRPDWIEVRTPMQRQNYAGLGLGETDALALAEELQADILLIDERRGRRVAEGLGYSVVGTLLILETGAEKGLLDLRESITDLRNTTFRISEHVIEDLLRRNA